MSIEIDEMWNDEELMSLAQRRLSLTVLANHFPLAAAKMFLDLIYSQKLTSRLIEVEQAALKYYRAYLDMHGAKSTDDSIGNVAVLMSLKRAVQQDEKLTNNWKITLIDEIANPFDLRDSLAHLYQKAKQQTPAVSSTYTTTAT